MGVAGVARVCRAAYADDLQFDPGSRYFDPKSTVEAPRWSMVDVEPLIAFPQVVSLEALRGCRNGTARP